MTANNENFQLFIAIMKGAFEPASTIVFHEFKNKKINDKTFYRLNKKMKTKTVTVEDKMFCLGELIDAGYSVNYFSEDDSKFEFNDPKDCPPLLYCIIVNECELATFFLDRGANVNEEDVFGQTPIYLAHSKEMVDILSDHGADLDHKNVMSESIEDFMLTYRNTTKSNDKDFNQPAIDAIIEYRKKQILDRPLDSFPSKPRRTM